MAEGDNFEETIAEETPEGDVGLTEEEGEITTPEGAGLGQITISPDLIEGLSDMNVGDNLSLIVDSNISDQDEDGNYVIALNTGQLAQGSPGTEPENEENIADEIAGGFGEKEETGL